MRGKKGDAFLKFKRILATTFALALTLPLLAVSAHPGRTDSAGGHTDTDTGDYHYHHGYPAHEHCDMDGDGQIDCPYEFVDAEEHESDNSDNKSSGNDAIRNMNGGAHITIGRTSKSESTAPIEEKDSVSSDFSPNSHSELIKKILTVGFLSLPVFIILFYSISFHVESNHPRVSSVLGYIASALFLVTLPLSGIPVICYFKWSANRNRRKEIVAAPQQHTSVSGSPEIDPPPLPPQTFAKPDPDVDFRPVILPKSEVSAHTRCRDTCRYLWYETLMLRSSAKPLISSDATVYIWTALFYTAVKTLRSQSSANRIYSYFSETTSEFVTEAQYTDLVVAKVREVYRELRETLNDSGIDPRTANGRRDLWRFLGDHSKELNLRPDLAYEFLCASQCVWEMIKDVFPQAQPYPKAGDIRYSIDDLPSA